MNNDRLKELLKKEADERLAEEKLYKAYPLLQYSTTQLKAELRRRKKKWIFMKHVIQIASL